MIHKAVYRFKRKNVEYGWMEIVERTELRVIGITFFKSDKIISSNM